MASVTRFYALILSTVLLLSGVPGFFPGFVSFQPLITFFALTLVHSVVHAAAGLLGLLITALASDDSVRIYTLGISLLYGILAGVGLVGINFGPVLTFNTADNLLHGAIFALSLGVLLAGVAEERTHRREQRISEALPAGLGRWAVPSSPIDTVDTAPTPASYAPFAPPRRTSAPSSPLTNQPASGYPVGPSGNGQTPWPGQLLPESATQNQWSAPAQSPAQSPWSPSRPSSSSLPPASPWTPDQPQSQPQSQPAGQPRDPWTRAQRRPTSPPPGWPASSPSQPASGGQQPGDPWSLYPPQQDQWPQNQPPQSPWPPDSQPSQNPNPWSRGSQSSPSENAQPRGDQWPLDEWPSLQDPRSR